MVNAISKPFPKHLMEKFGLLRYAAVKGKTRIEIEYDSDSGKGRMDVFVEDYECALHSSLTGTAEKPRTR